MRHFGGIKLGAGGLTRAYGNAARVAIELNSLYPFVEYRKIPVSIAYNQLQDLEYRLKNWGGIIESRSYTEHIELIVSLPEPCVEELKKLIAIRYYPHSG